MEKKHEKSMTYLHAWLFLKKQSIKLSLAVKLCNLKQKAFNKRYYVILTGNDKLISLSKEDIRHLQKTRKIQKGITHLDLMEKAFYYTPLSWNNDSGISKEERAARKKTYLKLMALKHRIPQRFHVV